MSNNDQNLFFEETWNPTDCGQCVVDSDRRWDREMENIWFLHNPESPTCRDDLKTMTCVYVEGRQRKEKTKQKNFPLTNSKSNRTISGQLVHGGHKGCSEDVSACNSGRAAEAKTLITGRKWTELKHRNILQKKTYKQSSTCVGNNLMVYSDKADGLQNSTLDLIPFKESVTFLYLVSRSKRVDTEPILLHHSVKYMKQKGSTKERPRWMNTCTFRFQFLVIILLLLDYAEEFVTQETNNNINKTSLSNSFKQFKKVANQQPKKQNKKKPKMGTPACLCYCCTNLTNMQK